MTSVKTFVAAAAWLLAGAPAGVLAQTPPPITAATGYDALILSFDRAEVTELSIVAGSKGVARYFAENVPGFGALEAQKPQLRDELAVAVEPVLRQITARTRPPMLHEMRALVAAKLSEAEAAELAAFFNSPTGLKFLSGYAATMAMDNTARDVEKGGGITVDSYNKDVTISVNASMRAMTTEDLAIMKAATETPAFVKFGALGSAITAVRVKYENSTTPEDIALLSKALEQVIERNFPDAK